MTNPTNPFQPFGAGVVTGSTTFSHSQVLDDFVSYTSAPTIGSGPQPSGPWEEKPADYYFEDEGHRSYFNSRRAALKQYRTISNKVPIWDEDQEIKLVDKLWREWFDEPYQGHMAWDYEPLNTDALKPVKLRKHDLAPFRIDYDTLPEIKLRLNNTVISVKGHPFIVKSIRQIGHKQFELALSDGEKMFKVSYKDLQDLRSIPPIYVNMGGVGWLCRVPAKVYQQGINRHNTTLRTLDGQHVSQNITLEGLVVGLRSRKEHWWDETTAKLLNGGDLSRLRLSDDLAVQTEKGKIIACYRGRRLGQVQDNEVCVFDEDDLLQEWIERSVRNIGMELRA